MKQYKAGHVRTFGPNAQHEIYYTNDFESFYTEDDVKLNEEDIYRWAVCISDPWDDSLEGYEITINLKDREWEWDGQGPKWKCVYSMTGYEGLGASVYGYGDTEEIALKECRNHLQWLYEEESKCHAKWLRKRGMLDGN